MWIFWLLILICQPFAFSCLPHLLSWTVYPPHYHLLEQIMTSPHNQRPTNKQQPVITLFASLWYSLLLQLHSDPDLEPLFCGQHTEVPTALLRGHHCSHFLLCRQTEVWLHDPPVRVHSCWLRWNHQVYYRQFIFEFSYRYKYVSSCSF